MEKFNLDHVVHMFNYLRDLIMVLEGNQLYLTNYENLRLTGDRINSGTTLFRNSIIRHAILT